MPYNFYRKYLLFFLMMSLPLVDVFAMSAILTLPLMLCFFLFLVEILDGKFKISVSYYMWLAFFVFAVISFFYSVVFGGNVKALNHLIAYFITIFFYFIVVSSSLSNLDHSSICSLILGLKLGWICAFLVLLCEFIYSNFGLGYFPSLPRASAGEYEPLALGLIRGRSTVEESGHFALYFITTFIVVFPFLKRRGGKVLLFVCLLVGVALTFSTSAILFMPISFLVANLLNSKGARIKYILLLVVFVVLTALVVIVFPDFFESLIINKFKSNSYSDRSYKLELNWELFSSESIINYLLGLGPGYYDFYRVEPVISFPFTLFFSFGFIGAGVFVIAILFEWLSVRRRLPHRFKIPIDFLVVFSAMFYLGISNFWYPWFWVYLAIFSAIARNYYGKC